MKRKANSEPDSAVSQTASNATETQHNPSKRQNRSRRSTSTSLPSPDVAESADACQSPAKEAQVVQPSPEPAPQADTERRKNEQSKGTGPQGRVIDVSKPRRIVESPGGVELLPAGKVFPIQIGSELFRLSGASITSDGKHALVFTLVRISKLRLLEHPPTFRIFSANSYTTTAVVLAT